MTIEKKHTREKGEKNTQLTWIPESPFWCIIIFTASYYFNPFTFFSIQNRVAFIPFYEIAPCFLFLLMIMESLWKSIFFPKEESKTKIMKPLSCSIFKQTYRTAFLMVPLPVFSIGLGGWCGNQASMWFCFRV